MTENIEADETSLAAVEEEVDAELAHVGLSADPAEADEPIRDVYATRLQGLRDAVVVVREHETSGDTA